MELTIYHEANYRVGVWNPGNGTRYTAVAIPWSTAMPMNRMGFVEEGWLVVYGNGTAHLLQKRGYLADRYMAEHFGILPGDFPWAGDLIRALIDRDDETIRERLAQTSGQEYSAFHASILNQIQCYAEASEKENAPVNFHAAATHELLAKDISGNLWSFVENDRLDRQALVEACTAVRDADCTCVRDDSLSGGHILDCPEQMAIDAMLATLSEVKS